MPPRARGHRSRASQSQWTAGAFGGQSVHWIDCLSASPWTTFLGLTPCHWHDGSSSVIERLWRSLKYEAVYLHDLTDGFHAERVIGEWIDFHNTERPHSALAGQTPAEAYGAEPPVDMMDKAHALPTSPQAQQPQQDVINKDVAA